MLIALFAAAATQLAPMSTEIPIPPPAPQRLRVFGAPLIRPIPVDATSAERAVIEKANRDATQAVIETLEPWQACGLSTIAAQDPASVFRGPRDPTQPPVWAPGANPYEGRYAAVDRRVNGCYAPLPISLPFADPRPANRTE